MSKGEKEFWGGTVKKNTRRKPEGEKERFKKAGRKWDRESKGRTETTQELWNPRNSRELKQPQQDQKTGTIYEWKEVLQGAASSRRGRKVLVRKWPVFRGKKRHGTVQTTIQ